MLLESRQRRGCLRQTHRPRQRRQTCFGLASRRWQGPLRRQSQRRQKRSMQTLSKKEKSQSLICFSSSRTTGSCRTALFLPGFFLLQMDVSRSPCMERKETVGCGAAVWCGIWLDEGRFAVCAGKEVLCYRLCAKSFVDDRLDGVHSKTIRSLAAHNDGLGRYLACASFDSTVSVWREDGGGWCLIERLEGHESEVKRVAWGGAEETLLASCGRDKAIWMWRLCEGEFECVGLLTGHLQDVKAISWLPGWPILFSCGYDKTVRAWHEIDEEWVELGIVCRKSDTIWDISFSPCASFFACVSGGSLFVFKAAEGGWHEVFSTKAHARDCYSVSWSKHFPSSGCSFIACGGDDNIVSVVRVKDGTASYWTSLECGATVLSVAWAEDGSLLCCTTEGASVWQA
eukprot:GHVN01046200.1.p1 GENE.GHVN01046200.1~~GHVN01046200.1.p1  ORF type:complete len:400 (+),score=30.25 GHVN01046200.1:508-1707(+)